MNPNGTYHYVSLLPIFKGATTPLAQWQELLDSDPWLKNASSRLAAVLYSMYPAHYKGQQPPVQTCRKVLLQTLRQHKTSRDAVIKAIEYLAQRGPARDNQVHIAKGWDFCNMYLRLIEETVYQDLRNAVEKERAKLAPGVTDVAAKVRNRALELMQNPPKGWDPEFYVQIFSLSYTAGRAYERLLKDLGYTQHPLPDNAPIGPVLAGKLGNVWYYPPGHKYTPPIGPDTVATTEPPPEPPAEPPA